MDKEKKASEILEKASEVLSEVDRSFIFTVNKPRHFPTFNSQEIEAGSVLGKGGFSDVFEVVSINLKGALGTNSSPGTRAEKPSKPDCKEQAAEVTDSFLAMLSGEDDHYDVATAREYMSQHADRHGFSRYAKKQLKSDLDVIDCARGAVDLATEIKFLSALWHPNIGRFPIRWTL